MKKELNNIYILIKEECNIIEIFPSKIVKSHKILPLLLLLNISIQNYHFHHWIHTGKHFLMLPEESCIN